MPIAQQMYQQTYTRSFNGGSSNYHRGSGTTTTTPVPPPPPPRWSSKTSSTTTSDNNNDSSASSQSSRKTHIEVCVRLRPLAIGQDSSTSFFTKDDNSSSCSGSQTTTSTMMTPPPARSRLHRKPQLPNLRSKSSRSNSKPKPDYGSGGNGSVLTDSNSIYAWDVVGPDVVRQSSYTDIVPGRTHTYTVDHVYGPNSTTTELYGKSVRDLVHAAMDGYHTAVLAYGQTSTGKTHTMTGTPAQPGLVPLCVRECFDVISNSQQGREYLLRVSYLEVYKEHIRDLLATGGSAAPPVRLFDSKEAGLIIRGLKEEVVTAPEEVFELMRQGESRRQIGATSLNQHSSRSHVMVRIWIESRSTGSQSHHNPNNHRSNGSSGANAGVRVSSLSLVDLAGSESVRLTGSSERRQEGHYINKSLMTLGQVVYSLSEVADTSSSSDKLLKHVPYRDSKLTRLLQPSLSGNAQVVLVCCISPLVSHIEESHNTFKFAVRAKKIPQKATQNTAALDDKTLLASYRDEIEDLKAQLKEAQQQQEQLIRETATRSQQPSADSIISLTAAEATEDEIQELVEAITTMEHLILKSDTTKTTPATGKKTGVLRPEEYLDQSYSENEDEELLALANGPSSSRRRATPQQNGHHHSYGNGVATPMARFSTPRLGSLPTPGDNTDLHSELSRIQGLLGSVLKKRMHRKQQNGTSSSGGHNNTSNSDEVLLLRQQLEQQEVTTSLKMADSSFLQKQLEEKDDLLQEVSKILESVEERQAALEAENASLREQVRLLRLGEC